jgi:hypothetical protein
MARQWQRMVTHLMIRVAHQIVAARALRRGNERRRDQAQQERSSHLQGVLQGGTRFKHQILGDLYVAVFEYLLDHVNLTAYKQIATCFPGFFRNARTCPQRSVRTKNFGGEQPRYYFDRHTPALSPKWASALTRTNPLTGSFDAVTGIPGVIQGTARRSFGWIECCFVRRVRLDLEKLGADR